MGGIFCVKGGNESSSDSAPYKGEGWTYSRYTEIRISQRLSCGSGL